MFFLDEEAADRIRMSQEERSLRIQRFMDDLPPDDAFTFYEVLSLISNADNSSSFANYMAGQMSTIVRRVHHICIACGGHHETDAHKAWVEERKDVAEKDKKDEATIDTDTTPEEDTF